MANQQSKPIFEVDEQGRLRITCDLSGPGHLSRSGLSRVLCSTRGNVSFELPDGRVIHIGLNVYQKIE